MLDFYRLSIPVLSLVSDTQRLSEVRANLESDLLVTQFLCRSVSRLPGEWVSFRRVVECYGAGQAHAAPAFVRSGQSGAAPA